MRSVKMRTIDDNWMEITVRSVKLHQKKHQGL